MPRGPVVANLTLEHEQPEEMLAIQYARLSELVLWERNPKEHDFGSLIESIRRHGFRDAPILDKKASCIIAGNGRCTALAQMRDAGDAPPRGVYRMGDGDWMVPVQIGIDAKSVAEAEAFGLDHNNLTVMGGKLGVEAVLRMYDEEALKTLLLDLSEQGSMPLSLDGADLEALVKGFNADLDRQRQEQNAVSKKKLGALREKFLVPPFSVLDTRQGYWKERISAWMELGVRSWRPENLLGMSDRVRSFEATNSWVQGYEGGTAWVKKNSGTSIFDPVLCELAYRWYCPRPGSVLDPFAGSSVSGIVAAVLGVAFTGIDLSHKQVEGCIENYKLVRERIGDVFEEEPVDPRWLRGDSQEMRELLGKRYGEGFDLLFSCPPYFDLERYSDDPSDLSAQGSYDEFLAMYENVVKLSTGALKNDRFCVWVISEIRDEKGFYRGFVADTVKMFQRCGLHLYNDATQVLACGSAALRAARIFGAKRKLVRAHQNVLIFVKGSPDAATAACGSLQLPEEIEALLAQQEREAEATEGAE